jgi:superfamily II DNA or RNA helicase
MAEDWRRWFPKIRRDTEIRLKQAEMFQIAATCDPDDEYTLRWLAELCTGYGKTIVALGVFWILKCRGIVERLLYLVPTDEQRSSMMDRRDNHGAWIKGDVTDFNERFGTNLRPYMVTKEAVDLRVGNLDRADVYVACYAQLGPDMFFHNLMGSVSAGRWAIVADECHHLGKANVQAIRQEALSARVKLGLSATPERSDGAALEGFPDTPTTSADYKQAWEEGVVKSVRARIGTYDLEIEIGGVPKQLTTDDLKKEAVVDFEKYEAKRQIRYHSRYVNQMMMDSLMEVNNRIIADPPDAKHLIKDQMLVFAMSCRHAHFLAREYNNLAETLGFAYRADWIGDGEGLNGEFKDKTANTATLDDFRAGRIHILVQVAKAQEGFNVNTISVIAFLHLIGATPRLLQQIGRGLRRRRWIRSHRKDTVTVFASSDTNIPSVVRKMEAISTGGEEEEGPDEGACGGRNGGGGNGGWLDMPDLMVVDVRHLKDEVISPEGICYLEPEQEAFCRRYGIPEDEYLQHFDVLARKGLNDGPKSTDSPPMDEGCRIKMMKEQVDARLGLLCRNVIRLLEKEAGRQFTKPEAGRIAGRVKKEINYQWKVITSRGHSEMISEEFQQKFEVIKSLNRSIPREGIPRWLREAIDRP